MAYYKAYHMDEQNIQIHLFCIPIILFTAILLLAHLPMPIISISWLIAVSFSTYYIYLDLIAGLIASPFLIIAAIASDNILTIKPVLAIHLLAWAAQFYGHFNFEGKSPAIFDNLIQPLVLAPYFVVWEILFMYGYKPDLETEMNAQAIKKRKSL